MKLLEHSVTRDPAIRSLTFELGPLILCLSWAHKSELTRIAGDDTARASEPGINNRHQERTVT